nr:S-layer homology domain-containing protein [uncultured Agathobaculum sp.]
MKKWFRLTLMGAAFAGALTVSALAAENTVCASHLADLGLFRGTEQGYELDRAPTRAEAAVMLVRLLGAEEQAQALTYTAPFTDLVGWERPYVQYLYENGLTTGTGADTFGPDGACAAQMYAAFLLRALGYTEEAGDFAYADAIETAQQYGIYAPAVVDTVNFLRDDVTAASYMALAAVPKGDSGTLLDRLVQDGAVDAAAAAPYQALFADYAAYRTAVSGMDDLGRFSVRGGLRAEVSGADSYQLTVHTEEYLTVNPTAGEATAEGVLTMQSPGIEDYVTAYHRSAVEYAGAERYAMLYGYGAVPLAVVEQIDRNLTGWTFTLTGLPPVYEGQLWSLSRVSGAPWQMPAQSTLVQTVRNGRITTQTLTAAFTAAGMDAAVTVTGELESAQSI